MNALQRFNPLWALLLAFSVWQANAQTTGTKVQWLGQSVFKITSPEGKNIVTDPWLKANPLTPPEFKTLENLGKVDVLLVSHGHLDHFADAPAIAKLNNVPMYAPGDMNASVVALGILPPELAPRFNKSGTVEPTPGIKVTAVRAEHSSVINWKNPATNKDEIHVGGEPIGFIIELEDGFKIYHMGDTGLFSDMKLIADYYKPDLVLMPIGGNFTMGPKEAAYAANELLKIPHVIAMHYGANPLAKGTLAQFQEFMKTSKLKLHPIKPGEVVQFPLKKPAS
jgi:L-ascorbate metabolism protein UlaG (beta-lactamase superfamily)